MIKKYDSSGGELYHDNCFNFETDIVDDEENLIPIGVGIKLLFTRQQGFC